MRRVDRDALRRAIAMAREASEADRLQIERKLADQGESWAEVGTFAAYGQQCRALNLKPWQSPPCWAGSAKPEADDSHGHLAAWTLRQRLLDAGLSQYEPDPLQAAVSGARSRR